MQASAIRETLKLTAMPDIISFAGGLPAPELLPADLIPALYSSAVKKYGKSILQYSTTEGFIPLRDEIVKLIAPDGIHTDNQHVIITSGSQQALDELGKVFINEGDLVGVEGPTYLGTLQAFNPYGPKYITIPMDCQGMNTDQLEKNLKKLPIKLVYFIPNFQNPTGRVMSMDRRNHLVEIAKKNPDVVFVEDDPYGKLRYKGKHLPSVRALSEKYDLDNIIYLSSFSKIFAPGIRLGFATTGNDDILQLLINAKQGIDLHTSTLNQALAAEYLYGNHLPAQLEKTVKLYGSRLEAMTAACHELLPEFSCSDPEGGMFVWIEGPVNMSAILPKAIAGKVAYISGENFYADGKSGVNSARLNFTNSSVETVRRGMQILSSVISSQNKASRPK